MDWLDAYRAARINQIVGMYSPDAVVECACGGRKVIYGQEGIAAYWRHRFIEMPALELEDLQVDGGPVVISYRTGSAIVQALLDIRGRWDDLSLSLWSDLTGVSWANRGLRSIVYETLRSFESRVSDQQSRQRESVRCRTC